MLGVKNNKLRRITPRENMRGQRRLDLRQGALCPRLCGPSRPAETPLIRRDGELQPATWDEALDLVARRLKDVIEEHGPQAIAGLGSTRVTNEANYLFQRFMRTVVGSNNVDHLGRMPAGAQPLSSLPELEDKDAYPAAGLRSQHEAPLVELWIKKAVLRHGAQCWSPTHGRSSWLGYGGPWLGYRLAAR